MERDKVLIPSHVVYKILIAINLSRLMNEK